MTAATFRLCVGLVTHMDIDHVCMCNTVPGQYHITLDMLYVAIVFKI